MYALGAQRELVLRAVRVYCYWSRYSIHTLERQVKNTVPDLRSEQRVKVQGKHWDQSFFVCTQECAKYALITAGPFLKPPAIHFPVRCFASLNNLKRSETVFSNAGWGGPECPFGSTENGHFYPPNDHSVSTPEWTLVSFHSSCPLAPGTKRVHFGVDVEWTFGGQKCPTQWYTHQYRKNTPNLAQPT